MKVKQKFIFHKENTFGITSGNHDSAIINKHY